MKPVVVRNTLVFWILLLATAFGDQRRAPTLPGPAIQQRLAQVETASPKTAPPNVKIKAIVLRDADHGTALLETSDGIVRVRLHRDHPTELVINGIPYSVSDFDARSVKLNKRTPASGAE